MRLVQPSRKLYLGTDVPLHRVFASVPLEAGRGGLRVSGVAPDPAVRR